MLQTHRDVKPIQNRWFRYASIGQNHPQTRTTVGERGHLGGIGPAYGFQCLLDLHGEIRIGFSNGAESLAGTVSSLDVADADLKMTFGVFAASYEALVQAHQNG